MNLQGQFWTPRPLHRAWGHRELVTLEAPAVNAEWDWTVPSPFLVVVETIFTTVTVEAAGKEVSLAVEYFHGEGERIGFGGAATLTKAESTQKYCLQRDYSAPANINVGFASGWLPSLVLEPGDQIKSFAGGLEGTDKLTAISLYCEFFEADPQHDLAEIEALARRIYDLERKVAEHALPVHQ